MGDMGALWQWMRRWWVIIRLGNGQMGWRRKIWTKGERYEREREEEDEIMG